jgi:hypothetical protein
MAELEHELRVLAAEVEWPATPAFDLRRPLRRRAWRVAVAAVALAVGIAFAVPASRGALLRFLHVGGVTVERVRTLPPARERSLAASLGRPVSAAQAAALLGEPFRFPEGVSSRLYASSDVVSTLLAVPEPVLLSELRVAVPGGVIVKKLASLATRVQPVRVAGAPGIWIEGAPHAVLMPAAPPRLAGAVLVWARGGITYRLEGKSLTLARARALAARLTR